MNAISNQWKPREKEYLIWGKCFKFSFFISYMEKTGSVNQIYVVKTVHTMFPSHFGEW